MSEAAAPTAPAAQPQANTAPVDGQPATPPAEADPFAEFDAVLKSKPLKYKAGGKERTVASVKELLRKDLVLMIGNAQSGSVGLETRQTLDRFNLYPQVVAKAAFLMPDSRSLALSLKRGEADVTLSWRATAFFPDNAPHMDTIDLDPKITPPQGLLLIQLTFSRNPEMARKFSDYVASPEGQATFRKFGFLDASQKS